MSGSRPGDPGGGSGGASAMQENAGTGEVAESGEIRREPGDNVDALANALQNATIAQLGEASTAGRARSRDQAGVLRPSRSRAGRGADGRQDLSRRGRSVTPHDIQIQTSGRPAGRDRFVQTADTILHHADMAEIARLRARNAELEAAASASAPARPSHATGSQSTAADLAAALQILLQEKPELMAGLRPGYAQAAALQILLQEKPELMAGLRPGYAQAAALQILLQEKPELMAGLRPVYAQAASLKSPAELLRN